MKNATRPLAAMLIVAAAIVPAVGLAWTDDTGAAGMKTGILDAHEMHMHHARADMTTRKIAQYELPRVTLIRDDGKQIFLPEELNDGKPVVMNFVFTSCTTTCPVSSRIFSLFQSELGSERDKVHMVSISIDPEQDTPSTLKKYAGEYGAGPGWHFYTGTNEASIATQQAFGVYSGDKMDQPPVTLLRAAPGKPWLRIDGLASAGELLHEYRNLVDPR